MSTLPNGPVDELDLAEVGRLLVRIVAVSRHLGHKRISGTAKDYMNDWNAPDASAEARFVHDVLAKSNDEIFDVWFQDGWVLSKHVFQGMNL